MGESREDLGYTNEKPTKALFRIPQSPIPNYKHEDQETTEQRKEHNLKLILEVFPEAIIKGSEVTAQREGKVFRFYPSTDTWFSLSKQKYGQGIEKLLGLIKERL